MWNIVVGLVGPRGCRGTGDELTSDSATEQPSSLDREEYVSAHELQFAGQPMPLQDGVLERAGSEAVADQDEVTHSHLELRLQVADRLPTVGIGEMIVRA